MKEINIDYLYLDNVSCSRCNQTETKLEQTIKAVNQLLEITEKQVVLNKKQMANTEMAIEYQFVSSPTIRVNGIDIGFEQKENECLDCGDLCASETTCRVWVLEGKEYDVPPKGLLMDRILKIVYGDASAKERTYQIPENLVNFYNGIKKEKSCCDSNCCN